MNAKNDKNTSAPIAIAIYQHITLRGTAVITSITICCLTNTVERIIKKDMTIITSLKTNGTSMAKAAASINRVEREQCRLGIQLNIFVSILYIFLTNFTDTPSPSGFGLSNVVG